MEVRKAVLRATGSVPLLPYREGYVYDLWHVHYFASLDTGLGDGDSFTCALSDAKDREPETTVAISERELFEDDHYYFPHALFRFLSTDVGITDASATLSIPLTKPLQVVRLAFCSTFFWTTNGEIGVEIHFEPRRVGASAQAELLRKAGQ